VSATYILVAGDARIGNLVATAVGTSITAVVVGDRGVAEAVAASGVEKVVWLGDPGATPLEAFAGQVAALTAAARPDLVLAPSRPADLVLAGAVAARLSAPVYTMASAVRVADGAVEIDRSVFGGIARETLRIHGPVVVIGDGGEVGTDGGAPIEEVTGAPATTISVIETLPPEHAPVDLSKARRIVSTGRGLKDQGDLSITARLGEALDAELACSRPLAEGVGWFRRDRYVGVTGQKVTPDLYVAVGISGQLQHVVGARGARVIVVINSDEKCPYFGEADYCVVGDLYELVPALTAALTEAN